MTEERPGVQRFARAFGPGVHRGLRARTGRERKAAAERLAEANEIGWYLEGLGDLARATEAGEDFVVNQHRLFFVGEGAQRFEPGFTCGTRARATLNRLDDDAGETQAFGFEPL